MYRLALTILALIATPAAASNFSARTAVPTSGRYITGDIVWHCGRDACQGSTDAGRPLTLCQSLARRAGRVESFIADGRALAAAELERCNAVAKPAQPQGEAAQ